MKIHFEEYQRDFLTFVKAYHLFLNDEWDSELVEPGQTGGDDVDYGEPKIHKNFKMRPINGKLRKLQGMT